MRGGITMYSFFYYVMPPLIGRAHTQDDPWVMKVEHERDIELTRDIPYLTHIGQLWGVYCEEFGEDLQCNEGTALNLVWMILQVAPVEVPCVLGTSSTCLGQVIS